ncbi:DoxX domain protein [Natrialba magadii ATCC 43099]|uniref:DoxX domain protein n=1 Tax=Natrialba magadii (strain ATCC 43099 / DSM 3394 / CCM 3739 / CIP 104546 / IAM 13178 / JCM 8861 / NBRC 102185 / NCIMB 2190 / MS3) TaxID=547559 RepID=D3SYF2_NATMM|nr:DoxX family protein [Natrialba magadii]ADD06123.1 DoxX domain protein [Natrialba magadii ATCC 43099]ELY30878.1 DoxX family protein [Natrialba magadii ATCC 43099]
MFDAPGADVLFVLARVLFGGVLAFTGLNHFLNVEEMAGYAEFKGIPAPTASVLLSGLLLVFGGVSIVLGIFPAVGAAGLAIFLAVSAITIHDFWNVDGADAQDEFNSFLKNIYGSGGALLFLVVSSTHWPYALNVGL